jgi:hypothetical protein
MFGLKPPRHISTLPKSGNPRSEHILSAVHPRADIIATLRSKTLRQRQFGRRRQGTVLFWCLAPWFRTPYSLRNSAASPATVSISIVLRTVLGLSSVKHNSVRRARRPSPRCGGRRHSRALPFAHEHIAAQRPHLPGAFFSTLRQSHQEIFHPVGHRRITQSHARFTSRRVTQSSDAARRPPSPRPPVHARPLRSCA